MKNYKNDPGNLPEDYKTLPEEEKQALQEWIRLAIQPAKTTVSRDSYALKHEYKRQVGLYVTNGQFKGAMLQAGYKPINPNEINWSFRIKRSNMRFKPQHVLENNSIDPVFEYSIAHISPEEKAHFDHLVTLAHQVWSTNSQPTSK
jgi:hypothetical protein